MALVRRGESVGESFETSVALARLADDAGYQRVWYAEHHNMPTIASSATTDYLTSHKPSALAAAQAGVEGYTATLAWGSGFFVIGAVIAAFLIPNRALEPSEGEPVMAH